METITLKDRPDLQKIVKMVDPKCRKAKAFLHRRNEVALSGTYWDGGSRSSYYLVNLATNEVTAAGRDAPVQFGGPRVDPVQKIEVGFAVVELGTFCGKPATPAIYLPIEG
jgi:hypothetical protein